MLARQYVPIDVEDEDLRTILLNAHVNDHYLSLGREVIIIKFANSNLYLSKLEVPLFIYKNFKCNFLINFLILIHL